MTLLVGTTIIGVALGMLIGILGLSIVVLHKATGVANFAQGALAMVAAFICLQLVTETGLGLWASASVSLIVMAVAGALIYLFVLRPKDDAGSLNITMRTLGLLLVLVAGTQILWADGQPYSFPAIFSREAAFTLGGVPVTRLTLGTIVMASALAGGTWWYFERTRAGLSFLALAANADVARLLGVRTRRLTLIAWMFASASSLVVAVLIAPTSLVSTDMMDTYVLFAFGAAVVGGLDSLGGVFVGGILIGIANAVTSVYVDSQTAVLVVFAIVLGTLVMRPQGLFGTPALERL